MKTTAAKGDAHLHTVFSDGTNTAAEMVRAAKEIGLHFVVITDHARRDSTHVLEYFQELELLKAHCKDLRIKTGLEVKFLDEQGTVDCKLQWVSSLDYLVVSFHTFPQDVLRVHGVEGFKSAWFRTVQHFATKQVPSLKAANPAVELVLGHPFSMWKKAGLEPRPEEILDLVSVANAYGFALEINVNPKHFPGIEYATIVSRTCYRYTYGSDAHSAEELTEVAPQILVIQELVCGVGDSFNA